MEHTDRDGRDAAGIGPYAREREELVSLASLEKWTVSDGEPDIRGWDVRTVSGRQLGTVSDLMVDANAGEVVLLDIDLPATDRHTFVPIRVVQIDRTRRLILMDSADLPDSDMTRGNATVIPDRRHADVGIVKYPPQDREIVVARPPLADETVRVDTRSADTTHRATPNERRQVDRRIERLSSDF
jgi:hypothetical protein